MRAATPRFYLMLEIQTEFLLLGQQVLHPTAISPGPRLPILQDPDSMLPCPPRGHSAMLSTPELPGHFPLYALILSHVTTNTQDWYSVCIIHNSPTYNQKVFGIPKIMSSCTLRRRQDSAFFFSFLSTWCALEVEKFHLGAEWLFLSLCFLWGCSVCLTPLILNSDASPCAALLLCQVSHSFESTFSFSSLSIRARTSLNPHLKFNIWTISGGLWLISLPLKIHSIFLVLYMSGPLGLHLRNWVGWTMRILFLFSCMLADSFAWLTLASQFRAIYCSTGLSLS